MKNTPLMMALLIAVGAASGALADDKKQDKQTKEKPTNSQAPAKPQAVQNAAPQKENTALTGSYIKRDVKRSGVITDGPTPVYVLDHGSIQTSGASDLSQVIFRRGFRR
jgi:hypothetical protein